MKIDVFLKEKLMEFILPTQVSGSFKFDDENKMLIEDIEIVANENTKATIIIKYVSIFLSSVTNLFSINVKNPIF